jgi:hypothetical protein
MAELRRARRGTVKVRFDPPEADLIRQLGDKHRRALLGDGPEKVTERLFPKAYADERDEGAYRELIGDSLRDEKLQALDRVTAMLDESLTVTLVEEDLRVWLATIADIRVALGVELEVDEEKMSAPLDLHDPDASGIAVIHWLGAVQHELIEASGGL